MNIIITGVNGFIGKNLYQALCNRHFVMGFYNSGEATFRNCFKVDLSAPDSVNSILDKVGSNSIDVIVHLASKMADVKNVNDVNLLNNNIAITTNIAAAAARLGVKSFINLSSSSVYPNIDGNFSEDSVVDPSKNSDCLYGLSKYNGEILVNYFLSNLKILITHLRTAIVYGEGMNASRIIKVLEKEITDTNTVTLFGNGERLLNIISVDSLVKYISFLIDHPVNDVINVADECISLNELANRLILSNGNDRTKIVKIEKGNTSKFVLDTGKLKKLLLSNKA